MIAASFSVRGSITNLGFAEALANTAHDLLHWIAGAGFVAKPVSAHLSRMRTLAPVARGLAIVLPLAVLLAVLLASADPIFGSFFKVQLDFNQLSLDVVCVVVASLAAAGILRIAAAEPLPPTPGVRWRLGAIESIVIVAVLDGIFAAFAVAQAIGAAGAGVEALRSAEVTYADYARSGFFQLLWVAGITLVSLVVLSRMSNGLTGRSQITMLALAELAILLTLLIVFVAFRRLALYEAAYGFTMLRLYSHVFAGWAAALFLLLAADIFRRGLGRQWFLSATLASAVLLLLTLDVINPEALVVGLNTSHATQTSKLDASYLRDLSSDAVPSLVSAGAAQSPSLRSGLTKNACTRPKIYEPYWAAWNASESQAADAGRRTCR